MTIENGLLLWMDFETTGLEVVDRVDHLLEIGYAITDLRADKWTYAPVSYLLETPHSTTELRKLAIPLVQEMHDKSGLWADHRQAWHLKELRHLAHVESYITNRLRSMVGNDVPVTLAGAGVSTFDFPIIKAFMPRLANRLTYYTIDTSTVERYVQTQMLGKMRSTSKSAAHRVVDDIEFARKLAKRLEFVIDDEVARREFPEWFEGEVD